MAEKILIVDDDIETLRLVGLMLQRQGFEISAANNGLQAISQATSINPDLIILDIMMPDMDGYEVTRRLRAQPWTSNIPILMFTAKGLVEDKQAGYDAGVDDYLTKPTHPIELTARIKALLSRATKSRTPTPLPERGRVIGFLSAKGGIGLSTTVLNVGILLHQKIRMDVILGEFRPAYGTWGTELGYVNPDGMNHLVQLKKDDITIQAVEKEITTHASGVKLLLASHRLKELETITQTEQYLTILDMLSRLSRITIIDFGMTHFPDYSRLLEHCDEIILGVEPNPTTVTRTKVLIEELSQYTFGKTKLLTLAMINHIRADVMMTWSQVQETLNIPVASIITPMPELAYQAALRYTPMVLLQPEGIIAQQYAKLADTIAQRVHP